MKKNQKNMTPKERVDKLRVKEVKTSRLSCEPLQTGDMTASLTLILDSMKRYGGMPFKYPPTAEGLKLFVERSEEYFAYTNELNANPEIEKKLILDVESWTVYLGISRTTLQEYSRRGGQWTDTIEYIKNIINAGKKQLALSFKIPAVLYMFDATNNHGYANSSEFKIQATTTVVNTEESALERELISSGLTWNEEKGDFDVIDVKGEFVNDLRTENQGNPSNSKTEGGESGSENIPGTP